MIGEQNWFEGEPVETGRFGFCENELTEIRFSEFSRVGSRKFAGSANEAMKIPGN